MANKVPWLLVANPGIRDETHPSCPFCRTATPTRKGLLPFSEIFRLPLVVLIRLQLSWIRWSNETVSFNVTATQKDKESWFTCTLSVNDILRAAGSALYSKQDVSKKLNQIHLDYRLHGTDKDIQDYYIDKFLKKYPYQENNFGLHKCFFDIEVDSSEITGFPEPEYALCPVNAITLVDINTKKIYTYALSYEGNEGYDNWLQNLESFKKRIIKRYKDELNIDFTLDIFTFDNEIMLIKSFFDVINNDIKPDFVCA